MEATKKLEEWERLPLKERNNLFTEVVRAAMWLQMFYPYNEVGTPYGLKRCYYCKLPCDYTLLYIGEWCMHGVCVLQLSKPEGPICKFSWEFLSPQEGIVLNVTRCDMWKGILDLYKQDVSRTVKRLEGFVN